MTKQQHKNLITIVNPIPCSLNISIFTYSLIILANEHSTWKLFGKQALAVKGTSLSLTDSG